MLCHTGIQIAKYMPYIFWSYLSLYCFTMLLNYIARNIKWLFVVEKLSLSFPPSFPVWFSDFLVSIRTPQPPRLNLPFISTFPTLFSSLLVAPANPPVQPIQKWPQLFCANNKDNCRKISLQESTMTSQYKHTKIITRWYGHWLRAYFYRQ